MNHAQSNLLKFLTLLLSLAIASEAIALSTKTDSPLIAQATTASTPSPAFPLPSTVASGTTIKIDGSNSMAAINEALKQQFEQQFSETTVEVAADGTDTALQALIDGKIDLAAIGRPLTAEEKAQGLVETLLSREKIAVIVGSENPFKGGISFRQFAQIFRGEITDWSELGGPPGPIRLVDRPQSSDTRLSLSRYQVFANAPFAAGLNAKSVAEDDTAAVVQALGKDGIGYAIASQVRNQPNARILKMHGTLPDNPRYPYSQPRGYVYYQTPNDNVKAFLGFATSSQGKTAIEAAKQTEVVGVTETASPETSPKATASPETDSSSPAAIASPSPDAATDQAATPEATSTPETALAPATGTETRTTTAGRSDDFAWLWWLLLPLLGGLLWWLLKDRRLAQSGASPMGEAATLPAADGATETTIATTESPPHPGPAVGAAAGGAATGAAFANRDRAGQLALIPRQDGNLKAQWNVPEEQKAVLRQQGGRKMMLRLYDVTGLEQDQQIPHAVKEFDFAESATSLTVPIEAGDRDYVGEVGYVTDDSRWLRLARSARVRIPAIGGNGLATAAVVAGGAALATGMAAAGERADTVPGPMAQSQIAQSQINLTQRDGQQVYANWYAPETEKVMLRQQGGQQFQLRIYDTTGIDLDTESAHRSKQYDCDERITEQAISLPLRSISGEALEQREYTAEIGYATQDDRWLKLARSNAIQVVVPAGAPSSAAIAAPETGLTANTIIQDASSTVLQPPTTELLDRPITQPEPTTLDDSVPATLDPGTIAAGTAAITGATFAANTVIQPSDTATTTSESTTERAIAPAVSSAESCAITHLVVHNRSNCFQLDPEQMRRLQEEVAVSTTLDPGTYLIRIKSGAFGYRSLSDYPGEPLVLLWIYGGSMINQKNNVEVKATWSTLNGYADALNLRVLEPVKLCAFFLDTYVADNEGEVDLSVVKL